MNYNDMGETCRMHLEKEASRRKIYRKLLGCTIAQASTRWLLTSESRVRSQGVPCEICGGQNGTQTCLSPSSSVHPCQYHSTAAPYSLMYHLGVGQRVY
jgi:hypothetical protein